MSNAAVTRQVPFWGGVLVALFVLTPVALFVGARQLRDAQPAGSRLTKVNVPDQTSFWSASGFVEMVQPIRLPSTGDESDRISIWLKVPEGTSMHVRRSERGAWLLQYPPGTVADRVESLRVTATGSSPAQWTVEDVRGTRLGEGGEEYFHVYLPKSLQPLGPLEGYEWPRSDRLANREATTRLTQMLGDALETPSRERLGKFRHRNECAPCHVHAKPSAERRNASTLVARPTDDAGFFAVMTVLSDTAPLEMHRPREMNVGDPYVSVTCTSETPKLVELPQRGRFYACADGEIPIGHLDLAAALAAGDERATGVCRSRAYLHAHLDPEAREAFRGAWGPCHIGR